jgi:hypothetical protein
VRLVAPQRNIEIILGTTFGLQKKEHLVRGPTAIHGQCHAGDGCCSVAREEDGKGA